MSNDVIILSLQVCLEVLKSDISARTKDAILRELLLPKITHVSDCKPGYHPNCKVTVENLED